MNSKQIVREKPQRERENDYFRKRLRIKEKGPKLLDLGVHSASVSL
jgi:hypothetical protein